MYNMYLLFEIGLFKVIFNVKVLKCWCVNVLKILILYDYIILDYG